MTTKIVIDGKLFDPENAKVSVFDRGFLYGDSAFEVMRTYGGVPFAEEEHLRRLRQSTERLLISMPVKDAVIRNDIRVALVAAANSESYIRVMITRGQGPLTYDPTTATQSLRVVIIAPLTPQPEKMYKHGVKVVCLRASRPTDDPRTKGVKASNYLSSLLAVHEAKERGGYEAILLGPGGDVLEGASSNVFVVKEGSVLTPPISSGILAGITRATVLRAASQLGIDLREASVFPRDLYDADEVFITSSLREVVPVSHVDNRRVAGGVVPGSVAERLLVAFREIALADTKKHA